MTASMTGLRLYPGDAVRDTRRETEGRVIRADYDGDGLCAVAALWADGSATVSFPRPDGRGFWLERVNRHGV